MTILKNSARDLSINKSNAYNDLFFDSSAMEKIITAEKLNDTIATYIQGFYNARNYEYAWFASTGLIEQAYSFHSLYRSENDSDLFNKSLENRLDMLRQGLDTIINVNDTSILMTELQVTERFIRYTLENSKCDTGVTPTDLGTYIPAKKSSIFQMADALLGNNTSKNNYASGNEAFRLLKVPLQQYTTIAKNGGWGVINATLKTYSLGINDTVITLIKKRLHITGELESNDTTAIFDTGLITAVKKYQVTHGHIPTGIINADLIKDMNIPAISRVQQILVNLQRMLWLPDSPKGKLIIVNIPEFEMYFDSGKVNLFHMDVVVGAEGHNTTMFSGNMNQIVFSPYWNIPASIVKKEVLPGIIRDKNYLIKRNMEITGYEGKLPIVRQLPGAKNALGKVKFLFPNSFNIYLHDTPEKGLFQRNERDLSHGCIRLSDAPKLAYYLLQNSSWTPEKIDTAMNNGHEQFVRLKYPVPVIITYYTAWVDDNGNLHFADDIYGHDIKMAKKMFTDPQSE